MKNVWQASSSNAAKYKEQSEHIIQPEESNIDLNVTTKNRPPRNDIDKKTEGNSSGVNESLGFKRTNNFIERFPRLYNKKKVPPTIKSDIIIGLNIASKYETLTKKYNELKQAHLEKQKIEEDLRSRLTQVTQECDNIKDKSERLQTRVQALRAASHSDIIIDEMRNEFRSFETNMTDRLTEMLANRPMADITNQPVVNNNRQPRIPEPDEDGMVRNSNIVPDE